eukprot:PhF_6_TR44240/c0_g1_i2/m.68029
MNSNNDRERMNNLLSKISNIINPCTIKPVIRLSHHHLHQQFNDVKRTVSNIISQQQYTTQCNPLPLFEKEHQRNKIVMTRFRLKCLKQLINRDDWCLLHHHRLLNRQCGGVTTNSLLKHRIIEAIKIQENKPLLLNPPIKMLYNSLLRFLRQLYIVLIQPIIQPHIIITNRHVRLSMNITLIKSQFLP